MSKEDFADLVYYKPSENSQMPCVYRPPMGLPFYWKHCEDRELTMHQALAMCGYSPDDQPRLERDICRQFGLRNVSDGDLEEMQTWVLSAWPLEELEYSLKSTYDSIGDTLRDVQRLYLQVGRQRNLLAGQFK